MKEWLPIVSTGKYIDLDIVKHLVAMNKLGTTSKRITMIQFQHVFCSMKKKKKI